MPPLDLHKQLAGSSPPSFTTNLPGETLDAATGTSWTLDIITRIRPLLNYLNPTESPTTPWLAAKSVFSQTGFIAKRRRFSLAPTPPKQTCVCPSSTPTRIPSKNCPAGSAEEGGGITSLAPSTTPPWTPPPQQKRKVELGLVESENSLTMSQRLLAEPLSEHQTLRLLW